MGTTEPGWLEVTLPRPAGVAFYIYSIMMVSKIVRCNGVGVPLRKKFCTNVAQRSAEAFFRSGFPTGIEAYIFI